MFRIIFLVVVVLFGMSKEEFYKNLALLKKGAEMGNTNAIYTLAILYNNGLTLDDGTIIKKDLSLALKYYKDLYDTGNRGMIFPIISILVEQKRYISALIFIENAINNNELDTKLKLLSVQMYANIYLNYLRDDKLVAKKAKKFLEEVYQQDNDIINLLYSLVLLSLNEDKKANYYLNIACKIKKSPKVKAFCENPNFVMKSKRENR